MPPWTVTIVPEKFLENRVTRTSRCCGCDSLTANTHQTRKPFSSRETWHSVALAHWKSAHHFRSSRYLSPSTLCSGTHSGSRKLSRGFGTACTRTNRNQLMHASAFSKLCLHSLLVLSNQSLSLRLRGLKTDHHLPSFVNPILELQKFVSVPILSEHQEIFSPSAAEVAKAVSIFSSPGGSAKHAASFVGSFVDGSALPDSNLPEVCKHTHTHPHPHPPPPHTHTHMYR